MKVSKPVLFLQSLCCLSQGTFFSLQERKRRPQAPAQSQVRQQGKRNRRRHPTGAAAFKNIPVSEPGAKSSQPEAAPPAEKPQFDKLQTGWVKNPFVLPQLKETKKMSAAAIRLSAIFEKGKDRVAIIDREVVREGDMVGDEKVLEIGRDKVVLIRNNIRRVLSLGNIEDTVREEEPKTKATEKGK